MVNDLFGGGLHSPRAFLVRLRIRRKTFIYLYLYIYTETFVGRHRNKKIKKNLKQSSVAHAFLFSNAATWEANTSSNAEYRCPQGINFAAEHAQLVPGQIKTCICEDPSLIV